jgi:subtilase family serine protease
MSTRSPIPPRRLAAWLAALLLLALTLASCTMSVTNNPTGVTPSTTPATLAAGTGHCPSESSSAGFGGRAYTPHDLRTAYGVESLCQRGFTGKGQTAIVIVSFGSPTLQQDVDAFSQRFGLPKVTVDVRAPIGTKPFDASNTDMLGWAGETTLDVEMIHGIAPEANIVVLTSPISETEGVQGLPEFRQLEQYAVDHHLGNVVNQSWDASEATLADSAGQQEITQWNSFYQTATTQQGMTFFAGSGDSGATDYCDLNVSQLCKTQTSGFPNDLPWVVAVGGTSLRISGSQITETAWTGSGGGFSKVSAEPSYQQQLPSSAQSKLNHRRGLPDVAATADPSTALGVYFRGQWQPIGGTSASSPLWAGVMTVANQMAGHPLGFINPALYTIGTSGKATQDFRDITSGNNTNASASVQGFNAVAGWDPVTGFGAPIADHLLPDLIAAATTS